MAFNLLDIKCENEKLLKLAFTHPSYTKENSVSQLESYERLEFLGDAVLKLAISNLMYNKYPEYSEGDLSKIRSILVSDAILSQIAKDINLQDKMILGLGEEHTGGRERESNIACTMEAVFGAYYLDGKFEEVERFLKERLLPFADDIETHFEKYNAKAVLQEYTQKINNKLPIYTVVNIKGPAHKPIFEVSVSYNDEILATAEGSTKKEAHQNAAYQACVKLGIIDKQ